MVLEPGPIVLEALPLPPRVAQPNGFLSIAAELAAALGGSDAALGGSVAGLAPLVNRTVGGDFDSDVATALDALDALGPAGDGAELADIAAAVDGVIDDIGVQRLDLPGPDDPDPGTESADIPDPGPFPGLDAAPPRVPAPPVNPDVPAPPAPPGDLSYVEQVRAAIRALYLELLDREPDPGGWDNWTREVVVNGHTLDWVREQGYASQEYREKHGG